MNRREAKKFAWGTACALVRVAWETEGGDAMDEVIGEMLARCGSEVDG